MDVPDIATRAPDVAMEERGELELKGGPGTWRLYAVADG
jgi:hypothetical protein